MVLLKSAVNLAHIFKVSAYEELKTERKPQNSWKREREKRKNIHYLYKYNNIDTILKGEKETKFISQTLALCFVYEKLFGAAVRSFYGAEKLMTQQLGM